MTTPLKPEIAAPDALPATSGPQRSRHRPPEVLSKSEVIALINACSHRAPTGIRNRALIAVLWRCGLRISEALALEPSDIDLPAGTLRVRHGTGEHPRPGGIDQPTSALLSAWLDRRAALEPPPMPRLPSSAPWPAGASTLPTFAISCPAWPAKPASTAACTPTASDTPTPPSSPASIRRST
jgi:integrase